MVDIGFHGPKFTWSNNRQRLENIRERIDRGVANHSWTILFPNATLQHLPICLSDHSPIFLDTMGRKKQSNSFKFKEFWIRDPTSQMVIQKAWNKSFSGTPAFIFSQKLKEVKKILKLWNNNCYGHIQSSIRNLTQPLAHIQLKEPTTQSMIMEAEVKGNLNKKLRREEILWR